MPIKNLISDGTSKVGFYFDVFIQTMVILSLVAFSVETLPDLDPATIDALSWFELFSVVVFSCEYLTRIYFAKPKRNYIFSVFGIIDLLAILPFFLGLAVDLRSIRIVRVLRVFRILKLARYSRAMRRFHIALDIAREELILFLCVTLILIYLAAVGIYYCENEAQPQAFGSVFHCLWWAISTLSTVGYGDIYPITVGGKIFTFVILLIGLGFISVPAGLVASALAKARQIEDAENASEPNQPTGN